MSTIERREQKAAKRWRAQAKVWAKEPPAEGYCRGKHRYENAIRVLRGEPTIPYPESKFVKRRSSR